MIDISNKWIIMLGAPGSGKGTQTEFLLQSTSRFKVICVGDILRQSKDVVLPGQNQTVGEMLGSGRLFPDELIIELVRREVKKLGDTSSNIIFDGFPRTQNQALALDNLASEFGRSVDFVLNFDISDDILIKRVLGRFKCRKCGKIYNDYFLNPRIANVCDACAGTEFERRADDNMESMQVRLAQYHSKTQVLIDFYKKAGILYNINAEADFEEVKEKVLEILTKERR